MKKFYLFFSGNHLEVLKELQKEGMVEINPLPEKFGFENSTKSLPESEEAFEKAAFLRDALGKVEGKPSSGKMVITRLQEKEIIDSFPIDKKYAEFFALRKELLRREQIEKKLAELKSELLLIRRLNIVPCELFKMKNFSFCLFLVNKKNRIPEKIQGFSVEEIWSDNKNFLFLTIFPVNRRKEIMGQIEKSNGSQIKIRRWNKLPDGILKKIDIVYRKNREVMRGVQEKLENISSIKHEILVFYDYACSVLRYQKAKQKLRTSRFVKGFSGWVRERDTPVLEKLVIKALPDSYLQITDPEINDDIPIALENKTFIEPFEVVTDLYGRPVYRNIDPTGPLSLFFALSFGFCVSDAAYGLVLIILSLLFIRKFRFTPVMMKFLRLILYSGIATLIMGAITGGWFGDMLNRLPENSMVTRTLSRMVILNPLEGGDKAFIFLGWTLIIGYLQILWGLTLNLFASIRQYGTKKSEEPFALLSIQIMTALLVLVFIEARKGIIPGDFIKIPGILLSASFIYLMVIKAKSQKGLIMRLFWALNGGYSVIAGNLLGDILSYSRLFGLGLTSAVLGFVVNEIVFMSTGIPFVGYVLGFLIFIVGHSGNLAISLLGGYVHTSRLQYLEFFTKFFESGGRSFSPLKEIREYTYIEKS